MGGATLAEPIKEGQGMKANGSALLCMADTEEDVRKLVESDIYYESGVWDTSKVGRTSRDLATLAWLLLRLEATAYRNTLLYRQCSPPSIYQRLLWLLT